jgi:hypothetical protein
VAEVPVEAAGRRANATKPLHSRRGARNGGSLVVLPPCQPCKSCNHPIVSVLPHRRVNESIRPKGLGICDSQYNTNPPTHNQHALLSSNSFDCLSAFFGRATRPPSSATCQISPMRGDTSRPIFAQDPPPHVPPCLLFQSLLRVRSYRPLQSIPCGADLQWEEESCHIRVRVASYASCLSPLCLPASASCRRKEAGECSCPIDLTTSSPQR